jgi:hypothetical protein
MTFTQFLDLSSDEILEKLQEKVRPQSKTSFIIAISKPIELDWPTKYTIQPQNFHIAYKKYNLYKFHFMRRFELISNDNEINVPNCSEHQRDDGLIYYFLKGINNLTYPRTHYNDNKSKFAELFRSMDKKAEALGVRVLESEKFRKFVELFYDLMLIDYEKHKESRSFSEKLSIAVNAKTEETSYRKKEAPDRKFTAPKKYPPRKLHFMYEQEDLDDDESVTSKVFKRDVDSSNPKQVVDDEGFVSDNLPTGFVNVSDYSLDDGMEQFEDPNFLQVFDNSDKKELPKVCFRELFFQDCALGDKCKWGHSQESLKKGFEMYATQLSKSKYKPSDYFVGYNRSGSSDKNKTPFKPPEKPPFRTAPSNSNKGKPNHFLRLLSNPSDLTVEEVKKDASGGEY